MTRFVLFSSILTIFLFSTSYLNAADNQKQVALLIGNAAYQHVPVLENPYNDAQDMGEALQAIGFDVDVYTDVSRQDMEAAFSTFFSKLQGADIGFFFYAGHGFQIKGKNYLIPVDAQISTPDMVDFQTIELDKVLSVMERHPKVSLVFLDACRDNPLAQKTRSIGGGSGLGEVQNVSGTLIAYATQPGNVAQDGVGQRNSPFTAALKEHIKTPGLEIRQILTRVRNSVMSSTNGMQVPWDHSSLTNDYFPLPIDPHAKEEKIAAQYQKQLEKLKQHNQTLQAKLAEQGINAEQERTLIEQTMQEKISSTEKQLEQLEKLQQINEELQKKLEQQQDFAQQAKAQEEKVAEYQQRLHTLQTLNENLQSQLAQQGVDSEKERLEIQAALEQNTGTTENQIAQLEKLEKINQELMRKVKKLEKRSRQTGNANPIDTEQAQDFISGFF